MIRPKRRPNGITQEDRAAVLDCFDGSIQGFQMTGHMRAELCVEALENACRKSGARGMTLHSDRGSQFTSGKFRAA